jgi:hypothetical protein
LKNFHIIKKIFKPELQKHWVPERVLLLLHVKQLLLVVPLQVRQVRSQVIPVPILNKLIYIIKTNIFIHSISKGPVQLVQLIWQI